MVAKKEFTFRGKTMDELKKMSIEEFAKLCNARARRSLQRGFNKTLEKNIEDAIKVGGDGKKPKIVRTHLRDTVIIPKMVGLTFQVYKGKEWETRTIEQEMLGHYLGELALTRKRLVHGKAGIGATRSSTAITARG